MGFDDSFNDNENDYSDIFEKQDDLLNKRQKKYGFLSDGYIDDEESVCSSCKASKEFFSSVMRIREKASLEDKELFEAVRDGYHEGSTRNPDLEFKALQEVPRTQKEIKDDILGRYARIGQHIEMDMDKIARTATSLNVCKTDLAVVVFLHELMHHLMRSDEDKTDGHVYWTFREEAMANALMLQILEFAGPDKERLRTVALKSITRQPKELGYTYAVHMNVVKRIDIVCWKRQKERGNLSLNEMDAYVERALDFLDGLMDNFSV